MTGADMAAVITALATPVAAAATFVIRWTSRAGKVIRELRDDLEDWMEHAYAVRRLAIRHGLTDDDLPEPPPEREAPVDA